MNSKQLKCVSVGLACSVASMCLALAEAKGTARSAEQLAGCIVKEERLVLSDGSAILLDHLAFYGTASEYLEKDSHPTASHPVGRIVLPRKCNLPNGSVLNPGWYGIVVEFKPGSDKLLFVRTDGIECLQSIHKELSSDIDYRMSHADTDGDGTVDDRERMHAFHYSGVFTKEELLDPFGEALKKPHLRPTYSGLDDSISVRTPSIYSSVWGTERERVSTPLQVKEIDQPRTRSSLEIRPADKKGSFILEVVYGRYMGTTSFSMIARPKPEIPKDEIPPNILAEVRWRIQELHHPDPNMRAGAVRKLGSLRAQTASAIPSLVPLLGDDTVFPLKTPPSSRLSYFSTVPRTIGESAAIALGRIGKPAEGALLAALKDKDWKVRANAIWALGDQNDFYSPALEESLIAALTDEHAIVREYAARAMTAMATLRAIVREHGARALMAMRELDEGALENPQAVAAMVAALLENPQAAETLIAALNDEHLNVRASAARALGKIKDPRAVEPLIAALKAPSAEDLAAARKIENDYNRGRKAVLALRNRHPRIDFQRKGSSTWNFVRYLQTLDDTILGPDYRDEVVFRYGKVYLQNATIREALDAFARASQCRWIARIRTDGRIKITFKDKDTNEYSAVRGRAAGALGDIGDRRAVGPLITALKDKDPHVRHEAAVGLGNLAIKDARVVELLIDALNDEFWRVRAAAAAQLGGTRDPCAFEPLIAALEDEHPNVRVSAAVSLGRIKDPKTVEPLIALLTDDNQSVRGAAAAFLGVLDDSRAIEPLIAMVRREDAEIPRVRGLKVLARLGHAGAAKAVREHRRHRSEEWWWERLGTAAYWRN